MPHEVWSRNQLTGKVKEIKKGMLMCQVKIELDPKGVMSSVFTLDSLKELGIKKRRQSAGDRQGRQCAAGKIMLKRTIEILHTV